MITIEENVDGTFFGYPEGWVGTVVYENDEPVLITFPNGCKEVRIYLDGEVHQLLLSPNLPDEQRITYMVN